MELLRRIGLLVVSIVLWIAFIVPRILIYCIRTIRIALNIIEETLTHLIKTTKSEILK